jgi:hypothetical protein
MLADILVELIHGDRELVQSEVIPPTIWTTAASARFKARHGPATEISGPPPAHHVPVRASASPYPK